MWKTCTFVRNAGLSRYIFHSSCSRKHTRHGAKAATGLDLSYNDVQKARWQQARRSVLIQYTGRSTECLDYLLRFGKVNHACVVEHADKVQMLVELGSPRVVRELLNASKQFPNNQKIPIHTRNLFFRGSNSYSTKGAKDSRLQKENPSDNLGETLLKSHSLSSQMESLHRELRLTETGTRLRYFLASTIEELARGVFPQAVVQMFGSTVNGLGRYDCDVDISLDIDKMAAQDVASKAFLKGGNMLFLSKFQAEDSHQNCRNILDVMAAMLNTVMPQCRQVHRVFKARVPIVQFIYSAADIECDLCMNNGPALQMAELLYILGQIDRRFCPLVFTVRSWARANEVNHSNPGPWPTQFMMTLLVIYYLQVLEKPILPPLRELLLAKEVEMEGGLQGVEYRLKPDAGDLQFYNSKNLQSLEELLAGFFQFYTRFDFSSCGISVLDAQVTEKEDGLPLYLKNPLEPQYNCSKNVMEKNVKLLQTTCANSLKFMETGKNGLLPLLCLSGDEDIPNGPPINNINIGDLFNEKESSIDNTLDNNNSR